MHDPKLGFPRGFPDGASDGEAVRSLRPPIQMSRHGRLRLRWLGVTLESTRGRGTDSAGVSAHSGALLGLGQGSGRSDRPLSGFGNLGLFLLVLTYITAVGQSDIRSRIEISSMPDKKLR